MTRDQHKARVHPLPILASENFQTRLVAFETPIMKALPFKSLQKQFTALNWITALFVVSAVASPHAVSAEVQIFDTQITLEEIKAAQKGWCDALLTISESYQLGGHTEAKAKASAIIDAAYAYQYGPVAFKPTYAVGKSTFRHTRDGALNYFVGPDPDIKQFGPKQGFATYRHWKSCSIENDTIQLLGDTANTMGTVTMIDSAGVKGTVEKTWTYWQAAPKTLRIILHHSSSPFDAR